MNLNFKLKFRLGCELELKLNFYSYFSKFSLRDPPAHTHTRVTRISKSTHYLAFECLFLLEHVRFMRVCIHLDVLFDLNLVLNKPTIV